METFYEHLRCLHHKLRNFEKIVDRPACVSGDDQSVLSCLSKPHFILNKKSSSIAYHFYREVVTNNEARNTYLNRHLNPSDMRTKSLPSREKRARFTSYFLHCLH